MFIDYSFLSDSYQICIAHSENLYTLWLRGKRKLKWRAILGVVAGQCLNTVDYLDSSGLDEEHI